MRRLDLVPLALNEPQGAGKPEGMSYSRGSLFFVFLGSNGSAAALLASFSGLLSRRFGALLFVVFKNLNRDHIHGAAGLFNRNLRLGGSVVHGDGDLGLDFSVTEKTQAVLGAAQNAGRDE